MKTLALFALIFLQLSSFGVESVGFNEDAVLGDIYPLIQKLSWITGYGQNEVLPAVFGEDIKFVYVKTDFDGYTCMGWLWCYGIVDPLNLKETEGILIHELGHKFLYDLGLPYADINLNLGYYENDRYIHVTGIHPYTGRYERTALGYPHPWQPYEQHKHDNNYYNTYQEDFADMFMNWALNRFSDDEAGRLRRAWIDAFVREHTPRLYSQPNRRPLEFSR